MDHQQEQRFANLSHADVEPRFLLELHGLEWPFRGELLSDFEQMLANFRHRPELADDRAPRFHIERFLDLQELDSPRFAAAKLGMTQDSLQALLPRLPEIGLRTNYEPYRGIGLIGRSLSEDLTRKLPGLRFKTFGTHDAFCELLHKALKNVLGFDAVPLYCATQDEMAAAENGYRMFAATWDNLTMLPLSVKHQVWLDLGKPLSLAPDRCSKLFYARNRERLIGHLVGRGEPRNMDTYLSFVGVNQNA
jgi:hypothetical protein